MPMCYSVRVKLSACVCALLAAMTIACPSKRHLHEELPPSGRVPCATVTAVGMLSGPGKHSTLPGRTSLHSHNTHGFPTAARARWKTTHYLIWNIGVQSCIFGPWAEFTSESFCHTLFKLSHNQLIIIC